MYILSNIDLWNANKDAYFVLMTYDSYAKISGVLFSYWSSKKLRRMKQNKNQIKTTNETK